MSLLRGMLDDVLLRGRDIRQLRALVPQPIRARLAGIMQAPSAAAHLEAEEWVRRRTAARLAGLAAADPDGVPLSFLTPVWNVPVAFLRELAASVAEQTRLHPVEWVVLDNGSTDAQVIECLDREIATQGHVRFFRSPNNLGIVLGTRLCLERATGRYVLRLDHDDVLYPDAAAIMGRALKKAGHPALAYSDIDHLVDGRRARPFLKPDWDPVLFLEQCYTAHLDAVDRELALSLGAYEDPACEASPDWDCFVRFVLAGHTPLHVPEVLYSWRMHAQSTAMDITAKSSVESSHRAVLGGWLAATGLSERFSIEKSPLFSGTPDWWIRRRAVDPPHFVVVHVGEMSEAATPNTAGVPVSQRYAVNRSAQACDLAAILDPDLPADSLVCVARAGAMPDGQDWAWEAIGVFDLHADAVGVCGRTLDEASRIVDAGGCLGFGSGADSPDAGRPLADPGYGLWLWKRHSVSTASGAFAVYRAGFLTGLLKDGCPADLDLRLLGAWAGAHARRTGRRIVYSPHITVRLG
ncbi:MAG TPA: glycosyltransferase, partial [Thermoleophilia bacterium]